MREQSFLIHPVSSAAGVSRITTVIDTVSRGHRLLSSSWLVFSRQCTALGLGGRINYQPTASLLRLMILASALCEDGFIGSARCPFDVLVSAVGVNWYRRSRGSEARSAGPFGFSWREPGIGTDIELCVWRTLPEVTVGIPADPASFWRWEEEDVGSGLCVKGLLDISGVGEETAEEAAEVCGNLES